MREFKIGDLFSSDFNDLNKIKEEIRSANTNELHRAIRASSYGKQLEQLYGTQNYYLVTIHHSYHSEVLEDLSANSFIATFRCKQITYKERSYEDTETVGTGTYSGTIDTQRGEVTLTEDTMTIGTTHSSQLEIKTNNLENVKTRVYHFASNNPNFLNAYNFYRNKRDEYLRIKKETNESNKPVKYRKKGILMGMFHIMTLLCLIVIPILSYFVKGDAFSWTVVVVCCLLFLLQIPPIVFGVKVKKRRDVDVEKKHVTVMDPVSIAVWAMLAIPAQVVAALFEIDQHMENNLFLAILRIAGIGLTLLLFGMAIQGYAKLVQELRNSDDRVELYLANSELSKYENNLAFVKREIICKNLSVK